MPPVKWLMHWHPSPGATLNTQILLEACGCAESLGGAKDGRWKTSIFFYRAMTRDGTAGPAGQQPGDLPRELLGVALHERPGLYFSIVRPAKLVLQADAAFTQVMEKLQSYKARVALHFEGFQYQLGDFCLRIGKCAANNSEALRGIMMEVNGVSILETLPCTFVNLKSLELSMHFSELPPILFMFCLLRKTPNLEKLKILIYDGEEQKIEADEEFLNAQWTDGMCANLQVVKLARTNWLPNELSFMKLILSKARLLRSLAVSHHDECSVSHKDPLNELLKCRRASAQAQVLFQGSAGDY